MEDLELEPAMVTLPLAPPVLVMAIPLALALVTVILALAPVTVTLAPVTIILALVPAHILRLLIPAARRVITALIMPQHLEEILLVLALVTASTATPARNLHLITWQLKVVKFALGTRLKIKLLPGREDSVLLSAVVSVWQ